MKVGFIQGAIISCNENADWIEDKVNKFLKKHKGIDIKFIEMSSTFKAYTYEEADTHILISIWYEERKG